MIKIDIKPLSVNEAFKGQRFKTDKYRKYQYDLLFLLPKMELPKPPYQISFEWGMSSILSDVDNPTKPTMDILCKKYGFDDRDVHRMVLTKRKVNKGQEYFKFKIETV